MLAYSISAHIETWCLCKLYVSCSKGFLHRAERRIEQTRQLDAQFFVSSSPPSCSGWVSGFLEGIWGGGFVWQGVLSV